MGELHTHCLRCGRKLKRLDNQILGYGPSCYKKVLSIRLKKKNLIEVEYDTRTGKTST